MIFLTGLVEGQFPSPANQLYSLPHLQFAIASWKSLPQHCFLIALFKTTETTFKRAPGNMVLPLHLTALAVESDDPYRKPRYLFGYSGRTVGNISII